MRTTSLTAMRAMLHEQVDEVFLRIIKVEHTDLPSPLLFVADTQDLVRTDGTYVAFGFSVNLPDDEEENIGVVNLVVPIVDQSIALALRSTPSEEPFTVTLSIVTAADPDTVEVGPFVFESVGISMDSTHATLQLSFNRNIFEDAYPKDIFSPSNRLDL